MWTGRGRQAPWDGGTSKVVDNRVGADGPRPISSDLPEGVEGSELWRRRCLHPWRRTEHHGSFGHLIRSAGGGNFWLPLPRAANSVRYECCSWPHALGEHFPAIDEQGSWARPKGCQTRPFTMLVRDWHDVPANDDGHSYLSQCWTAGSNVHARHRRTTLRPAVRNLRTTKVGSICREPRRKPGPMARARPEPGVPE
jgi:hypothetical protein